MRATSEAHLLQAHSSSAAAFCPACHHSSRLPAWPTRTAGRSGACCSFFLTCTCPTLLGEGVKHVLRQCAAEDGGRQLSRNEVAVLLVAARLAGLQEEAEHLLAEATLRPCFSSAPAAVRPVGADCYRRPGARLALSPAMRDKRRRLMARRAFDLFVDDELEEEWDEESQWLLWGHEHAAAAAAAGGSDSDTGSDAESPRQAGQMEEDGEDEEAAPSDAAAAARDLMHSMAQHLAALRDADSNAVAEDPDAPSTSAAAAAAAAAAPTAGDAGASTAAAAAAASQQPSTSAAATGGPSHHGSPISLGRRPRPLHLRHSSGAAGSPQRPASAGACNNERQLLAQLIADCASHNLLDVLNLLLRWVGEAGSCITAALSSQAEGCR